MLDGDIDLLADTIKCVLIDTGAYTPDYAAHAFLSDVAGGARIGTPQTLASKTTTAGVFDAADVTFIGVSGATVEGVLVYKDTGVEGTSPLICLLDGVTLTPNGGNVTVEWAAPGANAIFKL
jgi:hypothetical protein